MAAAGVGSIAGRSLLQFMKLVGQLKRVPRTGWVYRQVEQPESVSDHMYRMAVMAMLTKDSKLNKDRCIRLALVHDMAECIVGDIAPADNVSKEEKHRKEKDAMKHLSHLLSEELKKEIYELWEVVQVSGVFIAWWTWTVMLPVKLFFLPLSSPWSMNTSLAQKQSL
ncbi:5'-deoxynucleotidase HDDC2 isoform X2 [Hyperolius riggenbachi]|uniref:5'-deoxynucleotidase HDDC2 isoform X2 n=1 Tax=Hyperolius riggenbachi TaxID=752182 RepID=UPI0035A2EC74